MLISLDFTTLVANTVESQFGSDGSPYEKRVDAKGRVLSDKCIADEVPFEELPEGWCWTKLGNLLSLVSDGTHKTPQYTESGVLFLSVQNVSGGSFDLTKVRYISRETHEDLCRRVKPGRGDILLCRIGTLGKPIIVDVDYEFSIFVSLGLLRPISIAIAEWICSCIDSPVGFAWIEKVKVGGGTHTFKINLGDIPDFILPLPPLAEQRRIVERVGELMPLVEEYGELEDARGALDAALPGRLRKSVLQLAVQGGLVPQDPADEPAGVLLERIRGQRRQLAAEGKMKAPKGGESIIFAGSDGRRYEKRVDAKGRESEPVCIEDEIPFEIPEGWEWARLESVCILVRGSGIKRADVTNEGLPCVRYGELYTTYVASIDSTVSCTSEAVFNASKKLEPDEVLITLTGENNIDIGRAVFNATESSLAYGGDLLALKGRYLRGDYLAMAINSSAVGSQRTKAATGNIIVHLSAARASQFLLPIPPLAEQRRIIDCVRHILQSITN